ncbi:hypothetical protein T484DRAFT_1785521 [Baffinella frigidus]|nr:hypothetical protein T484DRAFT_1785521 [Cryptophyta sp. CCMP2293]
MLASMGEKVLVSMLASMGEKVNLIKEVPCDGHIVDWAKDLEASIAPSVQAEFAALLASGSTSLELLHALPLQLGVLCINTEVTHTVEEALQQHSKGNEDAWEDVDANMTSQNEALLLPLRGLSVIPGERFKYTRLAVLGMWWRDVVGNVGQEANRSPDSFAWRSNPRCYPKL